MKIVSLKKFEHDYEGYGIDDDDDEDDDERKKKVVRDYFRKLVHNAMFVCVYGPSFEAQVFNKTVRKKMIYRLLTNSRTKFLT